MRRIAAAIFLLAGTAAFGSPPDPCSLTSTLPDAKVTVGISKGQTSFREGEIIPLVLSFTSTAARRYWADNRNYDRSGRLDIETYCVEPAARDPLADYFKTGMFMGGGLVITQSSLGSALPISWQRFVGTALGAAVGGIVATYFGPHMVVFATSVFLLGLCCAAVHADRSAYRFAGVTLAIVLLLPREESAWQVALHRFAEVSIGIAVALIMTVLWPERHPTKGVPEARAIADRRDVF